LSISAMISLSQFFWPAMPANDLAVLTLTAVLSLDSEASQTPADSPPDPTTNPILCGRAPSTYSASDLLITKPLACKASTAAFCTVASGLLKTTLGTPSPGRVGVAEQPARTSMQPAIANFAAVLFITNDSPV